MTRIEWIMMIAIVCGAIVEVSRAFNGGGAA